MSLAAPPFNPLRSAVDAETRATVRWYRQYRAEARQPHLGRFPEERAREMRMLLDLLFYLRRVGRR
jgi:hypothetical protein